MAGRNFLKCAFAPPDFNNDPGQGIPDEFDGKVLSRKHVLTQSISFPAGRDTYILVAPTPGVAYWTCDVAIGGTIAAQTFKAVPMPGFTGLFGRERGLRADQVSAFRYASMVAGLYPTSNLMQFAGAISVWKVPLSAALTSYDQALVSAGVTIPQTVWAVNGLQGLNAVSPDNYTGSFIEGMFSQSVSNEAEFDFHPILEGLQKVPPELTTLEESGQYAYLDAGDEATAGFLGLGDMDAIVIKVTTATAAVNTAVLKTWACLEYRVNPDAAVYQYAHNSPSHDPLALAAYRKIAQEVPVAVACKDNATFWQRVLGIMNAALTGAMAIPGPVGMTATGIRGITDTIQALWV